MTGTDEPCEHTLVQEQVWQQRLEHIKVCRPNDWEGRVAGVNLGVGGEWVVREVHVGHEE